MRTIMLFCLWGWAVLSSCRSADPSTATPRTVEHPSTVSFPDLVKYYSERSDGLITPTIQSTDQLLKPPVFSWDPYNKRRILATSSEGPEEIQDLFEFNEECFVEGSHARDMITAAFQLYASLPFDWKKQEYFRQYRCLDYWGSLFHPPIRRLRQPLSFYHAEFAEGFDPATDESEYFDPKFQIYLDRETQTELTFGNELKALFNGIESFPEKMRLIEESKRFLFIAVMTIVADETGQEIIRQLIRRKRQGVDVRLILDDLYAFSVSNVAVSVLEREGIPVARVADKKLNQADRMFHNKFWIRDGEEAILGGMNVLDYENLSNGFNFYNRDTDIRVRGPAVTDLLQSYIRLWKRYDKTGHAISDAEELVGLRREKERASGTRGSEHYARWLADPATRMKGICRPAVQGNNAEPQSIVTLITRYLQAARRSFYITTPGVEFELGRDEPERVDIMARTLLEKLASPGFSATCITNGIDGGTGEATAWLRNRVKNAQLAGDTFWQDMLKPIVADDGRLVSRDTRLAIQPLVSAGLRGYQYFNYMHAKQFYFDRTLVGIGSWNFDGYSASRNHECAIFCLDEALRLQIEKQLVLDMINSIPMVTTSLRVRPRSTTAP